LFYPFLMADRQFQCGQFVKAARLRKGLDQSQLAKRVGMQQSAVSRIERDVVSPSLETLNRLMEGMGETLMLSSVGLSEPVPGGSNQSLREVLSDYRDLSDEERLGQAAKLSEMATELAAGAGT
jgi:transcriptional regulator with XRE-family HTH domain